MTNGDPRKACPSGRNCEEQERADRKAKEEQKPSSDRRVLGARLIAPSERLRRYNLRMHEQQERAALPAKRLQPGQNPRKALPQHKERGPAEYRFTQEDVAKAARAPLSSVRRARLRGEIPDWTLEGVIPWIAREIARRMELPLAPPRS